MKRISFCFLCFLMLFGISACEFFYSSSDLKEETETSFITTGYYDKEFVRAGIENNTLFISGISDSLSKKYIVMSVLNENGEEKTEKISDNSLEGFVKSTDISDCETVSVQLYSNFEPYGEYEGFVTESIKFLKKDEKWCADVPVVYEKNKKQYAQNKHLISAIAKAVDLTVRNEKIKTLSDEICSGIKSDYEKFLKIHDYICENIYYDDDAFNEGDYSDISPINAIETGKTLCTGISNLAVSLLRVQGIDAVTVSGYALGIGEDDEWNGENSLEKEPNHTWVEAYIDGRWIISDITWDNKNKYESGQFIKDDNYSHIMFDADLLSFSYTHKIINYF